MANRQCKEQRFRFKQFEICQQFSAMKVGTDGVLVAAWAQSDNTARILDIGSGTGLIGLMMCQRFQEAEVTGIEIDASAYLESLGNASRSPWGRRIDLQHTAVQEFAEKCPYQYGLIVSNPPFYTTHCRASDNTRSIARHTETLSYKELLESVKKLLAHNGRFCVILPSSAQIDVESLCAYYDLYIDKICYVKPTPNIPAKRILLSLSHQPCAAESAELVIEAYGRHRYSEEYKRLTADFYLEFRD